MKVFGVSLLIFWSSLGFAESPDFAHYLEGDSAVNSYSVENHQTIEAINTYQNQSSTSSFQPIYVGWYLSAFPSEGGCTESTVDADHPIGSQYISGLNAGKIALGFIRHITPNVAPGWYCLWSRVNDRKTANENAFGKSNDYVFKKPLCLGSDCPSDDELKMVLYPVPAQTQVTARLPNALESGDGVLRVIDAQGKIVLEKRAFFNAGQEVVLDLSDGAFSSGTYAVSLIVGKQRMATQIIKL